MAAEPLRHEQYTHGHALAVVRQHAQRTADEAAAFLLPYLQPGMRLLDVGCGPGSITRGLAERLTAGHVVGVDLSRKTFEAARRDATARGLHNLRYEEGSVYELPFADASFDVAYAHQVLQHLRERGAALREMLRVVRPGGLVAVREVDWSTAVYWPRDLWIDRFVETHLRTWYRNGGEPQMGRQLRALFNGAGVPRLEISASVWCYATRDDTVAWGESYADRLLTSAMGERASSSTGTRRGPRSSRWPPRSGRGVRIPTRSGCLPTFRRSAGKRAETPAERISHSMPPRT